MTGNALRRARAFLGWSQAQMAEEMGLSVATYQRREALGEELIPACEATHARSIVQDGILWYIEGPQEEPNDVG